jgi:hypothetical protein
MFGLSNAQIANRFIGSSIYNYNAQSIWNVVRYPALLPLLKSNAIGFYGENKFCSGLNAYQLAIQQNLFNVPLLLNANQNGTSVFKQQQMFLSCGKQLHPDFGMALTFQYERQASTGYLSKQSINGGLGLYFNCSSTIRIAVHADGLQAMVSENPIIPYMIRASLGYLVSPICSVFIETEKEQDKMLVVNAGIHYDFLDKMNAIIGYSTGAPLFSIASGYKFDKYNLGLGISYHPLLGSSTGLSIVHHFNQKK